MTGILIVSLTTVRTVQGSLYRTTIHIAHRQEYEGSNTTTVPFCLFFSNTRWRFVREIKQEHDVILHVLIIGHTILAWLPDIMNGVVVSGRHGWYEFRCIR